MADIVTCTRIESGKPSTLKIADDQPILQRGFSPIGARPSARA